ncbi:His_kinase domain-containing protein [Tenacibaculum sp. 190130A14a]|uniref:His_kinase domain-containing protein n=1 Tax=Tenacibaculum polynesiense TaxID=3137857 RepID=A0ABP1EXJ1_9FLAO
MKKIRNILFFKQDKKVVFKIVFWGIMLLYYISSRWPLEKDKVFLFEKMFLLVVVQILLTYGVVRWVIPKVVSKKHKLSSILGFVFLVYLCYILYTAMRCYYLLPKYPEVFRFRPPLIFQERITNGFSFLNNIPSLVFPTVILIIINYYRQQKEIISLKEQKRSSQLEALKNQLNPHFLFNTLNSLYALSLKKSDKSPEVIERLSDILDYILYKCKDNYVSIQGEITLLENYIALEQIRYGKRLHITFNHAVEKDVKIAPLLLLTLTENAFKHGVEEEINKAIIKINLTTIEKEICFTIENSIPTIVSDVGQNDARESIGLENIKKQLNLLYPSQDYTFNFIESNNVFKVTLKLQSK